VHANASGQVNRDYERIAREILEQADAIDTAEDEQFGDRRGLGYQSPDAFSAAWTPAATA